jgi:hypothetical protein
MTLLIGSVSHKHVFLTSDRRSMVEEQGIVLHFDTFQKIFPVPNRSLAVVHHGENVFVDETSNSIRLSRFLTTFMQDRADVFEEPSIETITVRFAERVEATILHTLKNRGKRVIAFWIAGFARGRGTPELYEVCWYKDGSREVKRHGELVVGGDGQEQLPPNVRDYLDGTYNLNNIPQMPVEKIRRYHEKLFAIGLGREPEPRRFSEERDQLSITKEGGCQWVIPPANQEVKGP